VREYGLGGGDTITTFTDTTVAQPYGIAVDDAGRVYVACIAVFLDSLQTNKSIRTRKFVSRVYRYVRGQRYPGVLDENMVGSSTWYRDSTWKLLDGSGLSSVADPRGIFIPHLGVDPIYVADRGNNAAKSISTQIDELPLLKVDGQETGASFSNPEGIAVDLAGFFYVVDRGNKRVLRYSSVPATFVQRVDVEANADGLPLADPIGIAVDDSLAYIGDRGRGEIIRYKRRP
jgi:DNA-binding beta-propeller fold protein YncE